MTFLIDIKKIGGFDIKKSKLFDRKILKNEF